MAKSYLSKGAVLRHPVMKKNLRIILPYLDKRTSRVARFFKGDTADIITKPGDILRDTGDSAPIDPHYVLKIVEDARIEALSNPKVGSNLQLRGEVQTACNEMRRKLLKLAKKSEEQKVAGRILLEEEAEKLRNDPNRPQLGRFEKLFKENRDQYNQQVARDAKAEYKNLVAANGTPKAAFKAKYPNGSTFTGKKYYSKVGGGSWTPDGGPCTYTTSTDGSSLTCNIRLKDLPRACYQDYANEATAQMMIQFDPNLPIELGFWNVSDYHKTAHSSGKDTGGIAARDYALTSYKMFIHTMAITMYQRGLTLEQEVINELDPDIRQQLKQIYTDRQFQKAQGAQFAQQAGLPGAPPPIMAAPLVAPAPPAPAPGGGAAPVPAPAPGGGAPAPLAIGHAPAPAPAPHGGGGAPAVPPPHGGGAPVAAAPAPVPGVNPNPGGGGGPGHGGP